MQIICTLQHWCPHRYNSFWHTPSRYRSW